MLKLSVTIRVKLSVIVKPIVKINVRVMLRLS